MAAGGSKACRRVLDAAKKRKLAAQPDGFLLSQVLKEHAFIQIALASSTYPYLASCGRWRCARCTAVLRETFLWMHTCTRGLSLRGEDLQAAGLLDAERGTCRLCGAKCRAPSSSSEPSSSTHACRSKLFNSTIFDLSDFYMPPGAEAASYETWAALYRSWTGIHVVIVTDAVALRGGTRTASPLRGLALPDTAEHVRFHALIDQTPLDPEGKGLRAVLSSAHVQEVSSHQKKPGHPVVTDRVVCAYTGLLRSAPLRNDRDLATMAIGSGAALEANSNLYIDPLRVGGVAYLMNHAHAPNANCESLPWNDKVYVLRLDAAEVRAGEELCYDYMAVTDKKKDAAILCRCCGEPLMKYEPARRR